MKIKDLKPGLKKVNLTAKIIEKENIYEFEKEGKKGKVCRATIEDDTGRYALTLWNEQTELEEGDKVQIINGFIAYDDFTDRHELTGGKYGKVIKK